MRDFYEIAVDEKVIKLAMLFHNADYSLVGRNEDGSDILIEINKASGGNYVSHVYDENTLYITSENGMLTITFYDESIFKAQFQPYGFTASDTSFTVVKLPDDVSTTLDDSDLYLKYSTSGMELCIEKYPLRINAIQNGDTVLRDKTGFYALTEGGGTSFYIHEDERFYGSGSRAIPVNRRGKNLWVYNEPHYGYENNVQTLNLNVPFVISSNRYGLFFDNRFPMNLDIGNSQSNVFEFATQGGNLRYYFIGGDSYAGILDKYTDLTGKHALPPLWSLGYIQSKYGYNNENEARNIVNELKNDGFPLDALVLDLYWFGQLNDMGNLDWDYQKWNQPEQMMADFETQGVKTILITEPYFTLQSANYSYLSENELLATDATGEPFVFWGFWAGDAGLLDITKPEATDWMWQFYADRHDEGVAGWWCDLGEPESHPWEIQHALGSAKSVHNIYSLLWAKMLFEKYQENYPNERLFNLIRSGFAGMQRYSTFPWSGDVQRNFSGLQAQIPIMLGSGMSGVGYMHSDVGGFVGEELNGELFARWVQFGVFAPVLRIHGTGTVEPVYYAETYKNIAKEYIKLRYRMLPYNYTLAYQNTTDGLPFARQMDFYETDNDMLGNINDQYFWGENMLVAPVVQSGQTQRNVVFPSGMWIDFHTHQLYNGNASYPVDCEIEHIPLFIKAGSFIPMATQKYSTADYNTDTLNILYYPEKNMPASHYTMYADNGKSTTSLTEKQYELIHFSGNFNDENLEISMKKSATTYTEAPTSREIRFDIQRITTKPQVITINDEEIQQVASLQDFEQENPAWYYQESEDVLYVHTLWNGDSTVISIENAATALTETITKTPCEACLHKAYPNPFHDIIHFDIDINKKGNYSLSVYTASGILIDEKKIAAHSPGRKTIQWNATGLKKGIYFVKLAGGAQNQVIKIVKM